MCSVQSVCALHWLRRQTLVHRVDQFDFIGLPVFPNIWAVSHVADVMEGMSHEVAMLGVVCRGRREGGKAGGRGSDDPISAE